MPVLSVVEGTNKTVLYFWVFACAFSFSILAHAEDLKSPATPAQSFSLDTGGEEMELQELLSLISTRFNINIIPLGNVRTQKVFTAMPSAMTSWQDALDPLCKQNDLSYKKEGDTVYVRKQEMITQVILMKYADVNEMMKILDTMNSEKGSISADTRSNQIVLHDDPEIISDMKKVLARLDVPTPQVTINAKIVDLEVKDALRLGVNVSQQRDHGNPDDTINKSQTTFTAATGNETLFPNTDSSTTRNNRQTYGVHLTDGDGTTGNFGDPTGSKTTFNFVEDNLRNVSNTVSTTTVDGLLTSIVTKQVADLINIQLDALISNGRTVVLASPTITTLNNTTASIVIGEKVGIKEQTQTTTGTTETVRFQDVGTKLEVTPQINVDGYITMKIKPEISSIVENIDPAARFSTQQAETNVRVKDDHTVIIGGLIRNQESKKTNRIPFISRIPILGIPFRGKKDDSTQRELVVFLTPHIVDDNFKETTSSEKEIRPVTARSAEDRTFEVKSPLERKPLEEKQAQEAAAKEKDILSTFGYEKGFPNNPTPPLEIGENKALAKQWYKEGIQLERKARHVDEERGKKIFPMAIEKFQVLAKTYPKSEYAPLSLYEVAMIQWKDLNDPGSANYGFEDLMEKYPADDIYRKAEKMKKKIEKASKK